MWGCRAQVDARDGARPAPPPPPPACSPRAGWEDRLADSAGRSGVKYHSAFKTSTESFLIFMPKCQSKELQFSFHLKFSLSINTFISAFQRLAWAGCRCSRLESQLFRRQRSGGSQFEASLSKWFTRPYLKKKTLHKKGLEACLASVREAMSSNPSATTKTKG
jgi:hypothetical protein